MDELEKDQNQIDQWMSTLNLAQKRRLFNKLDEELTEPTQDAPIGNRLPLNPSDELACRQGDLIGNYTLGRKIAEGGMGAVFEAKRNDDYQIKVAVKILKIHGLNHERVARFHRERQILADLQHPNIVPLFDGGTTVTGLPWLAMPLISGRSITDYANQHRLNLKQRLALFLDTCDAVAYAHRRMIIHRDLKPANILVDEAGSVKLLDFGIAGYLSAEQGQGLTQTNQGCSMMTPEYACPEQWRGERLTAAGDVFSLGLVLYNLLTGRHPIPRPTHSFQPLSQGDFEKIPKPSRAVKHLPQMETGAEAPKPLPAFQGFTKLIEGDLDSIVMHALTYEPEARYATVDEFGADIRRFLQRRPIVARPITRFERMRKAVIRNPIPYGAIVLVFFILTGTLVITENHRKRAEHEQRVATREKEQTAALLGFLVDLFKQVKPGNAATAQTSALELLELGEVQAQQTFETQPFLELKMKTTLAEIYQSREQAGKSETMAMQAYQIAVDLGDTEQQVLSLLLAANAQRQGANPEIAQTTTEQITALLKQHTDLPGILRLRNVQLEGWIDLDRGRYEEALAHLAVAETIETGPHFEKNHLKTKELRARVYLRNGQHKDAIPILEMLINHQRRGGAATRIELARNLHHLGLALTVLGRYREAEDYFREAAERFEAAYGEAGPPVGDALTGLAYTLVGQNRLRDGLDVYRRAYKAKASTYGENHRRIIPTMVNLADVLLRTGHTEEAEEKMRQAMSIASVSLEADHPLRAEVTLHWLQLQTFLGQYETVEAMALPAIATLEERYGSDHATTIKHHLFLTDFYHQTGRYAEGRAKLKQIEPSLPNLNPRLTLEAQTLNILFATAEDSREQVTRLIQENPLTQEQRRSELLLSARRDLSEARAALAFNNPDQAEKAAEQALAQLVPLKSPYQRERAQAHAVLAAIALSAGQADRAQKLLEPHLAVYQDNPRHPVHYRALKTWVSCLQRQNKADQATPILRRLNQLEPPP